MTREPDSHSTPTNRTYQLHFNQDQGLKYKTIKLTLNLDFDGGIKQAPRVFSMRTESWPGKVILIGYHHDRPKTIDDIASLNIRDDEVILVDRLDTKAAVSEEKNVTIYIDDQTKMLREAKPSCHVMLY